MAEVYANLIRRNLIEGLLALHNEGCIDDCHDAFLLSQ